MPHALLAALLVASATATAQTPQAPGGSPATSQPAAPAAQEDASEQERLRRAVDAQLESPEVQERLRREVDARVKAAEQQMREEMRAQLATQSLASDWKEEEWAEQRRQLELFTVDGYFRLRPALFYQMDLGRVPGRELGLFPRSPRPTERTQSGATMRLRLEPTLNISEEIRLKMQVDALDNVLLGSTPDTAFPADGFNLFNVFSDSQVAPNSGVNALRSSVQVKRAYGEVTTPVGILRFGRMGAHWGLGVLRHDGECLDCDFGDNADRVQLVTEPIEGFYVAPMVEFNAEGPNTGDTNLLREPVDLTNSDDANSLILVVARRDTEQRIKARLDNNQGVLNYGLYFAYRNQRFDAAGYGQGPIPGTGAQYTGFVPREATLFTPDVWVRYEEKTFKLELELVAVLGTIGSRALTPEEAQNPNLSQGLEVAQFGGVLQGEYRLLNGQLRLQGEVGFASGDSAPGMGAFPGRTATQADGTTGPDTSAVGQPQFNCGLGGCTDNNIRNFRFNRAYRVDYILWRELLGTVTDAWYIKPSLRYSLAAGFDVFGSAIYSQAIYPESTPSTRDTSLGVELNVGARYETEDGFVAGLVWAILLPMGGLQEAEPLLQRDLQSAQVLRAMMAIRF